MRLFADLKHFCAAHRAYALGGRAFILHGDSLSVFYLSLSAAFYAITLHVTPPQKYLPMSIAISEAKVNSFRHISSLILLFNAGSR